MLRAAELDTVLQVGCHESRGAESLPSTCWPHFFWCSPGYGWPSRLWAHIVGSCPGFHPPVPPSPSLQGCSQSFHRCHEFGWDRANFHKKPGGGGRPKLAKQTEYL